jgi:hypothetical protein
VVGTSDHIAIKPAQRDLTKLNNDVTLISLYHVSILFWSCHLKFSYLVCLQGIVLKKNQDRFFYA